MLIDAVVEKGQVRLLQPFQFAHDYFLVKVDIPEEEIVSVVSVDEDESPVASCSKQTSSVLLRKIWATRAQPIIETPDPLAGIEKKYE